MIKIVIDDLLEEENQPLKVLAKLAGIFIGYPFESNGFRKSIKQNNVKFLETHVNFESSGRQPRYFSFNSKNLVVYIHLHVALIHGVHTEVLHIFFHALNHKWAFILVFEKQNLTEVLSLVIFN